MMMNFFKRALIQTEARAIQYFSTNQIRNPATRANTLARIQIGETLSVDIIGGLSIRAKREGDIWLAERLAKHSVEEGHHAHFFDTAIRKLNKQVVIPKTENVKGNSNSFWADKNPFWAIYYRGYTQAQFYPNTADWLTFMASTHILEFDSSKVFVWMANVLPDDEPTSRHLKKGLLGIAEDEAGHAAYLYEAMTRRLPVAEVEKLVEEWRMRKVSATFALIKAFLLNGGELPLLVQDAGIDQKLNLSFNSEELKSFF